MSSFTTYEQQVNDAYDEMYASEAWKFFTQLTRRAFSPDVLHVLRNYAATNPHVSLSAHLPLLLSIVSDHVRLALEEASRSPTTITARPPMYDSQHQRRLAFKRRTLSLRPPISPSIPEHVELSDARRTLSSAALGPSRAATAGNIDELYGSFEAHADRHSICAPPPHREWSKSYRDLDTRKLASPTPSSPVHTPPPVTTSLENNANINNITTTISGDTEASFVRSKSLWRGRPKRRNSVRGAVAFSVAPLTALLDRRKRSKSPKNTTPNTNTTTNTTTTSTTSTSM